jgi:hypothetical protein
MFRAVDGHIEERPVPAKSVQKSVAFYKIVDKQGDPVPAIPWQDFLEDLSRLDPAASGHKVNGITHYGRVYPDEGENNINVA